MTRTLIVNGRFVMDDAGAVNAVARDLTLALDAETRARATGWEVVLAVPPAARASAEATGLTVRVHGTRGGIAWEQTELPGLAREGTIAGFFNTVPLLGTGHVTMLHDAHVFTTPASYGRATGAWRRLLSRRAGAKGNRVLTVSEHSREALLEVGIGAPDRIGVVPNGLGDVTRTDPDTGVFDRLRLPPGARYAVALSSLLPHKNIPLLLRAFDDPRLDDLHLVLVGKTTADQFAEAGHTPGARVHFPGFVSDAELAALYEGAVAVCTPSTQEGFGLPPLEGMARGTPAIVAPCGALPEVTGEAALQADESDPEAWVRALRRLMDDGALRDRLSRDGRRRAAAYTWENAARRTLAHLDRWFGD